MISLLLAGLAGVLASLSPCVLPLLPIVLGSALAQHRLGPVALALGLALSFATTGILLGLFGFAIGLDGDVLRTAGAVVMLAAGALLLSASLAARFSNAAEQALSPLNQLAGRMEARGLSGQFVLGLVLGLVWAPCTGPALGSAVALASQAGTAPRAALLMVCFAIGSTLPLLAIGYAARGAASRAIARSAGRNGRLAMGGALVLFGVLVLSGFDHRFEAWATEALPQRWVEFSTQI